MSASHECCMCKYNNSGRDRTVCDVPCDKHKQESKQMENEAWLWEPPPPPPPPRITYKHRCKRCGEQVVPATVAGNQRWANLKRAPNGLFQKWDYVCYGGSTHPFNASVTGKAIIILWHVGVEMDDQEVMDLDLLNAVLNW